MRVGECNSSLSSHLSDQADSCDSHIESRSSVFGTGLNYVALRLLGVDAEVPMMIRARGTLHHLGQSTLSTQSQRVILIADVIDRQAAVREFHHGVNSGSRF